MLSLSNSFNKEDMLDFIKKVNNFLRKQQEPDYVDEILNFSDQNETSNDVKNNNNTRISDVELTKKIIDNS